MVSAIITLFIQTFFCWPIFWFCGLHWNWKEKFVWAQVWNKWGVYYSYTPLRVKNCITSTKFWNHSDVDWKWHIFKQAANSLFTITPETFFFNLHPMFYLVADRTINRSINELKFHSWKVNTESVEMWLYLCRNGIPSLLQFSNFVDSSSTKRSLLYWILFHFI